MLHFPRYGRNRWRGRVSDIYDDIEQPYPDAKAAEKLIIGRPCFYLICENNGNFNESAMKWFILTNVVPNMCKKIPDSATLVFGKAIFGYFFHPLLTIFAFQLSKKVSSLPFAH